MTTAANPEKPSCPFDPVHHGGIQFAHDHPVEHLGDGFQKIQWTAGSQLSGANRHSGCFTCGGFSRGQPYKPENAPTGPFILSLPSLSFGVRCSAFDVQCSLEVHTLRFGNPPWLHECAPTLDAWCARHGLPLHITSTWDTSYPDPKFSEVDMLRQFMAGTSEWMLYVDADVVVHPSAPRPYFEDPGFYIREDTHGRANTRWFAWCQEKFGTTPDPEYLYRNAGVWACDRAAAAAMLAVIELPYHEGIMEQDQWNWWISLAAGQGMPLHILGHEWNRFPKEMKPSWFFHIFAKHKLKHLFKFRQKALLPDPVKPLDGLPPLIDLGPGAVVWPWSSTKAEWDELWFSCQSVLKHWSEKDWPLVLLADQCPDWWPGKFIHASRYEDALWLGTQCAGEVLWMNDDIFLLADQSPTDYERVPALEDMADKLGQTLVAPNSWRRGLGQVLMRLHHHRKTTRNYSTHTPYLYQREKVAEIFRRFGIFYKIPFESAYHNWHATPHQSAHAKARSPQDMAGKLWINPAFRQVTQEFRAEMAARFGPPP